MIPTRRLALALLPLGLIAAFRLTSAEAQTSNTDARFIFADTTLVRDTLGLTFERLFPLADSLRMDPASLKALSVRYRWTLARLVKMADSLDVPIDSVGPIMERERFNPLANVATINNFVYTSAYNVARTTSNWGNTGEYRVSHGPTFLSNRTDVRFSKFQSGSSRSLTQNREANTELGWRMSRNLSLGGIIVLTGYDNVTRGGLNNESERTSKFQMSVRSRLPSRFGFTADMNASGGSSTLSKRLEDKDGFSGESNGHVRYGAGNWLSHDLAYGITSTLSRAAATDPDPLDDIHFPVAHSRDNSNNLRGTLNLFRNHHVEFLGNYALANTRTQAPLAVAPTTAEPEPSTLKQLIRVTSRTADGTMRIRQNEDRVVALTLRNGRRENVTPNLPQSNNSREDDGFTSAGRFRSGRVTLDATFAVGTATSRYPRRDTKGGYRENSENRNLDGTLQWNASSRVNLKLTGSIGLTQARYARIDSPLTVPVPHDNASQSYRIDMHYTLSERAGTDLGFQVLRSQAVNLPAASTASNSETRSYRASWNWSYRLLEGLTATQRNQLNADYNTYPFSPTSNRLSLDYNTFTVVNAVFSQRFSMEVTHSARFQPSGNYRPVTPGDPTEYFGLSDENLNYSLRVRAAYALRGISLQMTPEYQASRRNTTVDGVLSPQRRSRNLNFSGGVDLNLQVGTSGRLSGSISRNLQSSRTESFGSSGVQITPRTDIQNWGGALTFTWTL